MKLICEFPAGTLRNAVTVNNIDAVATAIKSMPGVNKPFLLFASDAYTGTVTMADFELHPDWAGHGNVVNSDVAKNKAMIEAMLAAPPLDAIVYA
jgi:hypothetical protein